MEKLREDQIVDDIDEHNSRVARLSYELAKKFNLSEETCENIKRAAELHDVGKYYIPKSILNKRGKLTNEEFEIMKKHPIYSFNRLSEDIEEIRYMVLLHHESYNGTGYPLGLKGEEIPLGARIIKICDVFDALTNDRVYRKQLSEEQAIKIMLDESYNHDPIILAIFME